MLKSNLALGMIIFGAIVYAKKIGALADFWAIFKIDPPSWSK